MLVEVNPKKYKNILPYDIMTQFWMLLGWRFSLVWQNNSSEHISARELLNLGDKQHQKHVTHKDEVGLAKELCQEYKRKLRFVQVAHGSLLRYLWYPLTKQKTQTKTEHEWVFCKRIFLYDINIKSFGKTMRCFSTKLNRDNNCPPKSITYALLT